jgi:hypothetical protein
VPATAAPPSGSLVNWSFPRKTELDPEYITACVHMPSRDPLGPFCCWTSVKPTVFVSGLNPEQSTERSWPPSTTHHRLLRTICFRFLLLFVFIFPRCWILTAVDVQASAFWDVTPRSLAGRIRCFGGPFFRLQTTLLGRCRY